MPAPAGTYQTRLRWLTCSRTTDATTGQEVETHTPGGYLWASVDEVAGRRGVDMGATETGVDVQIRVRNYPAVTVLDLLRDEYQDYTYRLESVRNGDDELVIDAHRFDVLVDYTEAP